MNADRANSGTEDFAGHYCRKLLSFRLTQLESTHDLECLPPNKNARRPPDLCVWRKVDVRAGAAMPPLIVAEIWKRGDTVVGSLMRVKTRLAEGVLNVWMIDPEDRVALMYSPSHPEGQVGDVLISANPPIRIPLADVLPPS